MRSSCVRSAGPLKRESRALAQEARRRPDAIAMRHHAQLRRLAGEPRAHRVAADDRRACATDEVRYVAGASRSGCWAWPPAPRSAGSATFSWDALARLRGHDRRRAAVRPFARQPPQARSTAATNAGSGWNISLVYMRRAGWARRPAGAAAPARAARLCAAAARSATIICATADRSGVDAWWQLNCELRLSDPPDDPHRAAPGGRPLLPLPRAHLEAAAVADAPLLFYAMGRLGLVFWGVCARVTAGVLGHWLIGYFAHNDGAHAATRCAAPLCRDATFASRRS